MATGTIIVVVVVVVLVAAAAAAAAMLLRRRALRRRFGPEYDQLAGEVGERRAQAELAERERRVAQLDLRPLSPERRAGYGREWLSVQERFIEGPAQSVQAADSLVSAVAADRGYPADDEERLIEDLSVHHASRLDGYRQARLATQRAAVAGTEELRQALLAYRALFRDLLGADASDPASGSPEAGPAKAGDVTSADGDEAGSGTQDQDDRAATPAARKE